MKSLLALPLFFALLSPLAYARPSQVLIVRHGEDPRADGDVHLSPKGRRRAEALPQMFASRAEFNEQGAPVAVYAASPRKQSGSQRSIETCTPTAERFGLRLNSEFERDEPKKLVKEILRARDYDGKTVVICWTHDEIPEILERLGVEDGPEAWPKGVFDRVWKVKLARDEARFEDLPQNLLPGDSAR